MNIGSHNVAALRCTPNAAWIWANDKLALRARLGPSLRDSNRRKQNKNGVGFATQGCAKARKARFGFTLGFDRAVASRLKTTGEGVSNIHRNLRQWLPRRRDHESGRIRSGRID
jgi:hypothetical protein